MISQPSVTQTSDQSVQTGRWVLFASILASGMAFIDSTALSVALPALQADLGASGAELLWIVNAYALFLAGLLLLGGSLGDRLGRRRIFCLGIALFMGASIACGLALSPRVLITARAVQGVGGAFMIPGALAIISANFSVEKRGRAIGIWSALSVVTTAIGPVLGGVLTHAGLWRWIFFLNLPVAMIALTVLFLKVPESKDNDGSAPLDYWGGLLATIGLAGINYGLIESPARGLTDWRILISVITGAAALVLFGIVEARRNHPLLPLNLFRSRTLRGAIILTLLFYTALNAMLFFFPLNLIQVQGYDAAMAGLAQLPLMVFLIALSPWAGGLVDRYGPRLPLTLGPAISGLGFLYFALPGITAGPGDFWVNYLPPLSLLGVGVGITVTPLSATVIASVSSDHMGLASGINSAVCRLAGVLAIAILGPIALISFSQSVESHVAILDLSTEAKVALAAEAANLGGAKALPGFTATTTATVKKSIQLAFVDTFRLLSLLAAALTWLCALIAAFMFEDRRLPGADPPTP